MPALIPIAASVAGAAVSGAMNKKSSGNQTATQQNQLDPRMQGLLYGDGQRVLRPGVEAQMGVGTADDYRRMLSNEHLTKYGTALPTDQVSQDWMTQAISDRMAQGQQVQMNPDSDFVTDEGLLGRVTGLLDRPQNTGTAAFGGQMDNYLKNWGEDNFARSQQTAQTLQNSQIGAPQVNAPSQNNLNLSPAYQDMIYGQPGNNPYLTGAIQKGINQSNYAFGNYLTDSTKATEGLLGQIRGGAVLNNTMGSSRQGIAEGRAIGDFTQNLGRAATQFGTNNTDAAVAAQAGAYDTDRNRSLAAMSGLGAQQYGVASQNAQLQAQTNALNSQNQIAGVGLSSGLLDQGYKYAGNQDAYAGQKMTQAAGLLAPFTGANSTQVNTTPMYSNTAGSVVGGGLLGLQLAKGFNTGSSGFTNPNADSFNYFSNNYTPANYG